MKKVHFIGIGGIGISALAKFLHEKNYEISGSDIKESETIAELREQGMKINTPHDKSAIENQDFVVYSAAIKDDNVELVEARNKGIKCLSRKETLPYILRFKRVFAVAGAHGKSTTSAMLSSLIDGSVIIGAVSKQFGSNMKYSKSENIIFEADESDSSFLNSNPYLAVVTLTNCDLGVSIQGSSSKKTTFFLSGDCSKTASRRWKASNQVRGILQR
ncbi:MAG: hypothetical protein IKH66_03310, partial [Campylobacter sp.]|nr:hypothetical protein [Campylobacter sp.]